MKLKKLLLLIVFSVSVFWITDVKADTLNVTLRGTHYYDSAANVITMMNTERNSRGLDSVVLDRDLTIMANARARELSLFYSANHVRPDGTDAYASYGYDYETPIAGRYDSSATAYNYFVGNENYFPYMMSSTVKSVGAACFGTQNGYYYWIIVYSNSFSYNPSTLTGSSTKNEGVLINSNNVTNIRVDDLGNWNHASLGEVYALNGFSMRNNGFASAYTYINNSNGDWLSFDHTIATVDSEGVIRTHKRGSTTIQVSLGSASKSYTFVVDGAEIPITDITLSTNSITMDEGTSRLLTGTVYPTNATEDKTLVFHSLNEDVAIVNQNGLITGVSPGDTTITVSTASGDVTVTCAVIVNEIGENPDEFQLPHSNMTIAPGSSYDIGSDTDYDGTITWTSSNPSVAVVDQNGNVVGVGVGTATITATTEDGSSDTCFFSVSDEFEPESVVEVDQDEVILKAGEQTELNVTVDGATPGDSTITWSSSDESVVTVDQDGNVTAVGDGTATIIAIFEDGSSSTCQVTVSGMLVEPDGVTTNLVSVSLHVGETATIHPNVSPENATNKSVAYDSDDENVATVDSDGVITGVGVGNCTITVTTLNGLSTHVTVSVISSPGAIRSIEFEEETYEMYVGQEQSLNVIFDADQGADRTLTWESSHPNIISIEGGILHAIGVGSATITVTASNDMTASCTVNVLNMTPSVAYHTHIQDLGDSQGYVHDGEPAGTFGQSRRLESIQIRLENLPYSGSIRYVTHVQDLGWEDEKLGYWKMDDEMSGTAHQSKRLEAIKIFLRGDIATYYDVYYRVHAQEFGWMGWAKNGEMAGTASYGYRLEAIEIVLVVKGGVPPVRTNTKTAAPFVQKRVGYSTHVQDIGWQDTRFDGKMSGTSGQSKRLEAITISLHNASNLYGPGSTILYSTHIQDYGWEDKDPNRGWKRNGEMSGTSHESKRLEAIKIKLSGYVAQQYDVYYRVHAENFGWMGWAKNGEPAGTAHYSYRLEGIEIVLVPKGEDPPVRTDTKTSSAFVDKKAA